MNIDVKQYLLHRDPFLLVDGVKELENGKRILAYKNVKADEWFFKGHFPGNPVYPGVLMVEALAQAACVLMAYDCEIDIKKCNTYLTSVDNASFKRLVIPGDVLDLEVCINKQVSRDKTTFFKFSGKASVSGEEACKADFGAALILTLDSDA